jgi:hypothetical protein
MMTIPTATFEYGWRTFVTRFFISQNMKNIDVTLWPGYFYQKGKYQFANQKNMLTALSKTFFLAKTEVETKIDFFLTKATQAAILYMPTRAGAFLLYKKINVGIILNVMYCIVTVHCTNMCCYNPVWTIINYNSKFKINIPIF